MEWSVLFLSLSLPKAQRGTLGQTEKTHNDHKGVLSGASWKFDKIHRIPFQCEILSQVNAQLARRSVW